MNQKIKNYFAAFNKLNKKWGMLALLFFIIFMGSLFPRSVLAQVPGLNCQWYDAPCLAANFILSIMIKIVVLLVFGIPLLLSAVAVAIMALILGWVIGPDFISLKFTQNPFVDIGLSITKGFANMGFILFLVVIALATILRIEEYKAKKTLTTLILIALLINFSPVLCGVIIDFTNIVMNFFLSHITGLEGFGAFLANSAQSFFDLIVGSGFNFWANISAAMQVIVGVFVNFFAAFIFLLFSALFTMRYIMLWVLVIVSPIAFVSYILPITRRGGSILNWKEWWKQLIAWSTIGITAGFFLYLGITMISMLHVLVQQPSIVWGAAGGLGLMNGILPYLIPLILLWIAYRESKRTSAMFAREIVEAPEKFGKAAVQAAAMVAVTAATAGAGAAIGAAAKTGGGLRGAIGTMSDPDKWKEFQGKHKTLGRLGEGPARVMQWGRKAEKKVSEEVTEKVAEPLKKKVEEIQTEEYAKEHPKRAAIVKAGTWAGKGLKTAILGREEKQRELRPEEERDKIRYKYDEEKKEWVKTNQKLTNKEIKERHLFEIEQKPGVMPVVKDAMKIIAKGFDDAIEDQLKKMGVVVSLKVQKDLEKINELIAKKDGGGTITEEDVIGIGWAEKIIKRGDEITMEILKKRKAVLEERAAKEIKGVKIPKVSEIFSKSFRKKPKTPKKDETRPPTPPPPVGPGPEETGEGDSSGGVSPEETG